MYLKTVALMFVFFVSGSQVLAVKPTGAIGQESKKAEKIEGPNLQKADLPDNPEAQLRSRKRTYFETTEAARTGFLYNQKMVTLDKKLVEKMKKGTKVLTLASIEPKKDRGKAFVKTLILVEDIDTLDLMQRLLSEGHNPVALNMANKSHPGGGVEFGSPAQEESIFRRTNYFQSLDLNENPYLRAQLPHGYDIPEFGLIYSPYVQVFRKNEKMSYQWHLPFSVSMIAAAAYDLGLLGDAITQEEATNGMARKIRAVLRGARHYNHDAVVLGAWGCGAFRNDPQVVAQLMKEVLGEQEFQNAFSLVAFAILDMPYNTQNNLLIFRKVLLP